MREQQMGEMLILDISARLWIWAPVSDGGYLEDISACADGTNLESKGGDRRSMTFEICDDETYDINVVLGRASAAGILEACSRYHSEGHTWILPQEGQDIVEFYTELELHKREPIYNTGTGLHHLKTHQGLCITYSVSKSICCFERMTVLDSTHEGPSICRHPFCTASCS